MYIYYLWGKAQDGKKLTKEEHDILWGAIASEYSRPIREQIKKERQEEQGRKSKEKIKLNIKNAFNIKRCVIGGVVVATLCGMIYEIDQYDKNHPLSIDQKAALHELYNYAQNENYHRQIYLRECPHKGVHNYTYAMSINDETLRKSLFSEYGECESNIEKKIFEDKKRLRDKYHGLEKKL